MGTIIEEKATGSKPVPGAEVRRNPVSISLYYGDEEYLLSQEAKRLRESIIDPQMGGLGYKLLEKPHIGEVLEAIGAVSFSLGGKTLIEIRDFEYLHKAADGSADEKQLAELCELLADHDPGKHIFFYSAKVNRTVKFAKWLTAGKNVPVDMKEFKTFPFFKTDDAVQAVLQECRKQGIAVQPQAVAMLVENLGVSIRPLMSEIAKLSVFAGERAITPADVQILSNHNENTFQMLADWLHDRERAEVFATLEELFLRQHPLPLFGLTQSWLGGIYQLRYWQQMGLSEQEMAERTKKHPFKVKKDLQEFGRVPFQRIEMLKRKATELETKMKTGELESHLAFEMLMGA